MNIGELAKFRGGIATDTISEVTSASGVTIDGLLNKDGAAYPTGAITGYSALAADADTTLTITSNQLGYLASPAAARTVTLPTTGVKAGWRYRLEVSGATETNYVVINSSGANEIDRIGGAGYIEVMALQDTPTTAAHWRVINVQEVSTLTGQTYTFQNSGTITNRTIKCLRSNKTVQIYAESGTVSGSASNSGYLSIPIPARFLTSVGSSWSPAITVDNTIYAIGMIQASTGRVYSSPAGGTFSATGGLNGLNFANHWYWQL